MKLFVKKMWKKLSDRIEALVMKRWFTHGLDSWCHFILLYNVFDALSKRHWGFFVFFALLWLFHCWRLFHSSKFPEELIAHRVAYLVTSILRGKLEDGRPPGWWDREREVIEEVHVKKSWKKPFAEM